MEQEKRNKQNLPSLSQLLTVIVIPTYRMSKQAWASQGTCWVTQAGECKQGLETPSPHPARFEDKHLSYSANPVQRGGGLRKHFFRWTASSAIRLPASSQEQGSNFSGPQAWV